jgi:hypothetical protein
MNRYSPRKEPSYLKWALITLGIITLLIIIKFFSGSEDSSPDASHFLVSGSGEIIITNNEGERREFLDNPYFGKDDSMLSVRSGNAALSHDSLEIWVDKGSELAYRDYTLSGIHTELIQGRSWIEAHNTSTLKLKHLDIQLQKDDIILVEQQRIHSIVYSLRGSPRIFANG